jgi:type II secretory pathway predicted ATPase ExeA
MNDLYRQFGQNNPQMNNFMQNFQKFRQGFTGNPQQQVQQLLNSGKVTQAQYNAAVQRAQGLMKMLGM